VSVAVLPNEKAHNEQSLWAFSTARRLVGPSNAAPEFGA